MSKNAKIALIAGSVLIVSLILSPLILHLPSGQYSLLSHFCYNKGSGAPDLH